jgi:hypothetical protein
MRQEAEQIKQRVKQAYSYLTQKELDYCFDLSLHDFIRCSFPSANDRPSAEKINIDFLTSQWLYARMLDILGRAGGTSVVSYRENGVNWSYGASYIDPALVAQIMPKASVPK